jgi:hypothetical protein
MASATPAVTPEPPRLLRWRTRIPVLVERLDGLELAMVRIPAGAFVLGQTPITQAQWRTEGVPLLRVKSFHGPGRLCGGGLGAERSRRALLAEKPA